MRSREPSPESSQSWTLPEDDHEEVEGGNAAPETFALSVVWCRRETDRVGELLIPGESLRLFGRGGAHTSDPHPRLRLVRDRPHGALAAAPFAIDRISRAQLLLRATAQGIDVQNIGRCPMAHNGAPAVRASVREGDLLTLGAQLMFLCIRRPSWLPAHLEEWKGFPFGAPDAHGIVGESAAMWALRRSLGFVAAKRQHVLVTGASGTGKELVARAIHALSSRRNRPFLARNAATFPETLVDAELFGNAKSYPNAGMPERPGLVGEAHEGTLFLDEVGELSAASQAHLLRVLDAGEYHRLGEASTRRSDLRLIGATNRPASSMKEELRARFPLTLTVPDLNARREDIPLLICHLLRRFAAEDPEISRRFFPGGYLTQAPLLPAHWIQPLVQHHYTTHVRELEAALWSLLALAPGETTIRPLAGLAPRGLPPPANDGLTAERIRASLEEHNGVIEKAWRVLGLKNRHALVRLIVRYGIEVRRRPGARQDGPEEAG